MARSPIAVLCSDIHRSHAPPVFRSEEPDWYAAMDRPLRQVVDEANRLEAPLVIAGDIFDRWATPAETINATISVLKGLKNRCFAVPGQHDLPNHSYEDIRRSSYWTLVESGVLVNLEPGYPRHVYIEDDGQGYELAIHGFPWGFPPKALERPERLKHDPPIIHLAVVHAYLWSKSSNSFPGAPEENRTTAFRDGLSGYDAAIFGDNHIGFLTMIGETNVLNCGGFMIRKSDEVEYRPQYGILMSDGSIETRLLDTHQDIYILNESAREKPADERTRTALLEEMNALGAESLDFRDALDHHMNKAQTDLRTRSLVYNALG